MTRARAAELGLGEDIVVQGSHARGTASPTSDLDVAIRVDKETFDALVREQLGEPNPGSAWERTMQRAVKTRKNQAGEAGLSPLRKGIEGVVGRDVDISIVLKNGPFDNGATLPLAAAS